MTSTYVVEIEDLLKAPGQARVRPVAAKPCGFSTPMLGVESLLDKSNEWTIHKRQQGTGGADLQEVRFTSFRRGDPNDTPDEAINFDAQDKSASMINVAPRSKRCVSKKVEVPS